MNTMCVSRWLMVSPKGPETCAENGALVHLRQGDADGACGPYALMMALLTLGVLERKEITDMNLWDGRSREGKFRNALISHGALISSGTNGEDLAILAADSMTIRTLIPRASGHRFHGHPDTFRQAATQEYSLPSTSFIEAKRSSWSVYPCVNSERYYA